MKGEQAPHGDEELSVLATHCTAREDAANRVERRVRKSAAALLLSSRIRERIDAIVTGALAKGIWVIRDGVCEAFRPQPKPARP
jgi:exoribonuclease-2